MAQLKLRGFQRIYKIKEEEAEEIKEVWKNDQHRPDTKLEIGPLNFRKSDIQIIEMEDRVINGRGIDLSDPLRREEVWQFENEFNEFLEGQPKEKQTIEHYLQDRKLASFQKPRIAQSGYERFGMMSIINPQVFSGVYQKYGAMQAMSAYEERNMPELDKAKETLFSDEINVKEIPF